MRSIGSSGLEWFREVGYIVNGDIAAPPGKVTLYRGGVDANRMAWTPSRPLAEWFRDRWPGGRVWTVTVGGEALLAHFSHVRDGGDGEVEFVIDPSDIQPEQIP
jgi:hypothetical protein